MAFPSGKSLLNLTNVAYAREGEIPPIPGVVRSNGSLQIRSSHSGPRGSSRESWLAPKESDSRCARFLTLSVWAWDEQLLRFALARIYLTAYRDQGIDVTDWNLAGQLP